MTPPADPTPKLQEVRPEPQEPPETLAVGAAPSGARRRQVLLRVGGAVAALAALAFGVHLFLTRGDEGTDDAQVEADVAPVAPRVGGPIAEVLVQEDAHVTVGQPLARIDDADYSARVRQAEAELGVARAQASAADAQVQVSSAGARGGFAGAQATVQAANAGVTGAGAQVEAARAALLQAQAQAEKAGADLSRAKELKAADAIAQQQFDAFQATADTTQAGLAAAKAQLAAAEENRRTAQGRAAEALGRLGASTPVAAQIAAAQAQAALAHARVQSAEAALDLARLQLSYTVLRAPADGTVSRWVARVGQILQPGQVLGQLVPDRNYVVANFKETQLAGMKPGQAATVEIDAYPGRKLEGRIQSIAGGTGARFALLPPDNASGNFVKVVERVPVRITLVDPPRDLPLRAGLSAYATVHTR